MPYRTPDTSNMILPICTDEPHMTCGICQAKFKCTHFLDEYRRILEDKYGDEAEFMFNWALEKHRQDHPNS